MRVLHPFVVLIFPILVAALPLHDSGVVQDPTAPSKLAARFSFDPAFFRPVLSAADNSNVHSSPASPPQHPHALSGFLEPSVLDKRKKIVNPPTSSFGWLPGFQGPTWPRANRDEQTEPTTEASRTLAASGAPDFVVNELSITADLVKKSAKFLDESLFGMSKNGDGAQWGRPAQATEDEKRYAVSKVQKSAKFLDESLFGMSKNGDGAQWGRPAQATEDEKRYAVSKVPQADSTEVKSANAVVLRPGEEDHPGHNTKAFGFGPSGEGPGWH
ncbi:hypothetical protein A4X06_0g7774 [Tilletia controversa]|uniref:Uncharacterized protein n=3 Tax=Tilletia TaxID=13289 RepID=A0A8X7MM02_9BASI|nr:hypothetical protein A4X06_0g7774 [Tilletia controversa]KAE8240581.1 hypothetical protein A4X03_0g8480 [Tilletia caries]